MEGVDVTVEHVAGLEEKRIAESRLQHRAGKISPRLEAEAGAGTASADSPDVILRRSVPTPAPRKRLLAHGRQGAAARARGEFDVQAMRSAVTPQQISTEETKLRQVEESIRVFVRVADPKFRQVVPMRFFNLTLTPAEADACSADYLEEKSPRGKRRTSAAAHCGRGALA